MQRRHFLKTLLGALTAMPFLPCRATPASGSPPAPRQILLQSSPVAGFQFYHGEELWHQLRPGAPLALVAEPDNPYDRQAVKVIYRGRQLGYVPRLENTAISQLLARNQPLTARIAALRQASDPWQRVTIDILLISGGVSTT
ncbi:MAG: HIRAN domain-containing protein [Desulfopila sp.]